MEESSRWISHAGGQRRVRVRLFCLPHAGGAASFFRSWSAPPGSHIEICAIQLPGREERMNEPPFRRMAPLVSALAEALAPVLDAPYALLGHSMGAVVGFELGRELRRRGKPLPLHLFACGHRAPHLASHDTPLHDLPEQRLVDELRRFAGTPEEVLSDPDMMGLILPSLRADFELCETYNHTEEPPLPFPIAAFGGLSDDEVMEDELLAWRDHTASAFRMQLFPGNHFFVDIQRLAVLETLSADLESDLRRCSDATADS